jgi:hypothetical protein
VQEIESRKEGIIRQGKTFHIYGSGFGGAPGRVLIAEEGSDKWQALDPKCLGMWTDERVTATIPNFTSRSPEVRVALAVVHKNGRYGTLAWITLRKTPGGGGGLPPVPPADTVKIASVYDTVAKRHGQITLCRPFWITGSGFGVRPGVIRMREMGSQTWLKFPADAIQAWRDDGIYLQNEHTPVHKSGVRVALEIALPDGQAALVENIPLVGEGPQDPGTLPAPEAISWTVAAAQADKDPDEARHNALAALRALGAREVRSNHGIHGATASYDSATVAAFLLINPTGQSSRNFTVVVAAGDADKSKCVTRVAQALANGASPGPAQNVPPRGGYPSIVRSGEILPENVRRSTSRAGADEDARDAEIFDQYANFGAPPRIAGRMRFGKIASLGTFNDSTSSSVVKVRSAQGGHVTVLQVLARTQRPDRQYGTLTTRSMRWLVIVNNPLTLEDAAHILIGENAAHEDDCASRLVE